MQRILIVEDEPEMSALLAQAMSEHGYACDVAHDGKEGLRRAPGYDLLLVDVMLPAMNGFTLVETLRGEGEPVPVIFLTARDSSKDMIHGLEVGGDDYLVKPFKLEELVARVRAALRRAKDSSRLLHWQDITLDCTKRTGSRDGADLYLSMTEFALMELFMRRPDSVLSKAMILEEVWSDEGYRDENLVETYVTYLRRKTEAHGGPRVIQTIRGRGYILALA